MSTLTSNHWVISDVSWIDDRTRGGTGGETLIARKDDEILAGFERFYRVELLSTRNHEHFYRGAMYFDLVPIAALKSKVIDKALLSFKIRSSTVQERDGKPVDFPTTVSCAAGLYTAGEDWMKSTSHGEVIERALATDRLITKLDVSPPGGTTFNIDVTKEVRQWVVTPGENLGVVLQGRDEEVTPARNDACATRYGELALEVHYTVFEP